MTIEPDEATNLEFLSVLMTTGGPLDSKLFFCIELVQMSYLLLRTKYAIERKNRVFVGIPN